MTTYLLDELSIGHILKKIRVTNGRESYEGVLTNFTTSYEYTRYGNLKDPARMGVRSRVELCFEQGYWDGDPKSDTFTVVE